MARKTETTTIFTCDRCAKSFQLSDAERQAPAFATIQTSPMRGDGQTFHAESSTVEICWDCCCRLVEWLEGRD